VISSPRVDSQVRRSYFSEVTEGRGFRENAHRADRVRPDSLQRTRNRSRRGRPAGDYRPIAGFGRILARTTRGDAGRPGRAVHAIGTGGVPWRLQEALPLQKQAYL